MKEVVFRPLRRIKKTGKITVSSYSNWRSVRTADYNEFRLIVADDYKAMASDEFVHNHKGELLFWAVGNPADIPIYDHHESGMPYEEFKEMFGMGGVAIAPSDDKYFPFYMGTTGCDVEGIPAFVHYTSEYVARIYERIDEVQKWEPLTVGTVVKWIGWFLYQLKNSRLQIGK